MEELINIDELHYDDIGLVYVIGTTNNPGYCYILICYYFNYYIFYELLVLYIVLYIFSIIYLTI